MLINARNHENVIKLNNNKNKTLFSRKGMKATVVLFFFLGMSSLLFCINPKDSGIYEDAYMVTNAVLKGSQVHDVKSQMG